LSPDFPPVIILCGGLGTRLGDVAQVMPKAMMAVAGMPFIAHQMRLLARENVKRVVLCVSHLQEQIEEFVGDGEAFGLSVSYSYDGPVKLGTGGAVRKALPLVGDQFAVLYGDTYLDIAFAPVYQTFEHEGRPGLMTVLENGDRWDKSNILFADNAVKIYDKNAPSKDMRHIDYGLILLAAEAIADYPLDQPFDLTVVFKKLIDAGQMSGYEVFNRFYEIGTPQALRETEEYLSGKLGTSNAGR
jgi:NDP-sugar pyrophosphorylase family protein